MATTTGYLTTATINGNDYLLSNALYGTCETAASTAAKVVVLPGFDSLETGVTIHVKFTYSNTASNATMNVNSTGAKNLCRYGTTRIGTTDRASWRAGAVVSFTYDGTSWIQNDYLEDTGVTTDTKNTAGSTNSTSKLFLIGATSQASNPQTYSNSNVYEEDGALHASSFNGVAIDRTETGFILGTSQLQRLEVNNGPHILAAAASKGVDTSIASGSTSTNLPTSAAVAAYVATQLSDTAGALVYKGTATALTDITDTSYKKGWYWIVGSNPSITIDGMACEAGDMIIAQQDKTATANNDLDVIQTNIETLTNAEIDTLWTAA